MNNLITEAETKFLREFAKLLADNPDIKLGVREDYDQFTLDDRQHSLRWGTAFSIYTDEDGQFHFRVDPPLTKESHDIINWEIDNRFGVPYGGKYLYIRVGLDGQIEPRFCRFHYEGSGRDTKINIIDVPAPEDVVARLERNKE